MPAADRVGERANAGGAYGSVCSTELASMDNQASAASAASDACPASPTTAETANSTTTHISTPAAKTSMSFTFQRNRQRRAPNKLGKIRQRLLAIGPRWCSNPDIQKHCKLILLSVFFCTFGSLLFSVGLLILCLPPHPNYSVVFAGGGVIIFVPGIYHLVYIVRAHLGHDGYSFQDLPLME